MYIRAKVSIQNEVIIYILPFLMSKTSFYFVTFLGKFPDDYGPITIKRIKCFL